METIMFLRSVLPINQLIGQPASPWIKKAAILDKKQWKHPNLYRIIPSGLVENK